MEPVSQTPTGPLLANMKKKVMIMKKKFNVNFKADTWYYAIEAETQEEAIWKALDSFLEYEPDIYCEECKEEDDPSCSTCYNADQDTTDKVACCNCCEDYCFYTRA